MHAPPEREAVAGIRALSLYIHRAWRRVERIVSMNELPDDAGPSGRAGCSRPSEQILKKVKRGRYVRPA
jgi:hypothetical protein